MPSVTSSAVIQPVVASPFGAVVARQLSVWPFAARTARLFVLVDPSLADESLRQGLLRAMQQGYFASDGYSQTRAVREAALAAHYVLQHHNRDVLPLLHATAASAVAAVRGKVAFVALAGQATAYAWHDGDGELTSSSGVLRLPKPLGLEQDPALTLWRTPLKSGDRLVLVCGARCIPETPRIIQEVLQSTSSNAAAQRRLSEALGDSAPAGVLVISSSSQTLRVPHLRLVGRSEEPAVPAQQRTHAGFSARRLVFPMLGLVLLTLLLIATLVFAPRPRTLVSSVVGVTPRVAVDLGDAAADVVDMVVGDTAVYTLGVSDGAVRAFALDRTEQQPAPETLVARDGTVISTGHELSQPVAIEYLPGAPGEQGTLAIIDQSRDVVQVGPDGTLSPRAVPTSSAWQALGALGAGPDGELLFLDSRAHELLAYPTIGQASSDPPRLVVDGAAAPRLPFERVAQVLSTPQSFMLRLDDGTVRRLEPTGADEPLTVQVDDSPLSGVSAIAPDRAGGMYLADPLNARVVQTRPDGTVLRELRTPAFAGVRAIDVSLDGARLYALVDSGILVVDIPTV
jgi:hypothetical protein